MTPVLIEFNSNIDGGSNETATYTKWVENMDDLSKEEKEQVLKRFAYMQLRITQLEWINADHKERELVNDSLFISIIKKVCESMRVTIEKLKSKSRDRESSYARMMAMVVLRKKMKLSLKTIGNWFNRDHTTVMHAIATIHDLVETDQEVRHDLDLLMNYDYQAEAPSNLQVA